jgi:magnesium chelatase family protein
VINFLGIPTIGFATTNTMEGNKAQKPCPCGYYGDGTAKCHCTADQIEKYKNKISGPLLDRIDMVLTVPPLPKKDLLSQENANAESSEVIRKRVLKAYEKQINRQGKTNDKFSPDEINKLIKLDKTNKQLLSSVIDKLHLSAKRLSPHSKSRPHHCRLGRKRKC